MCRKDPGYGGVPSGENHSSAGKWMSKGREEPLHNAACLQWYLSFNIKITLFCNFTQGPTKSDFHMNPTPLKDTHQYTGWRGWSRGLPHWVPVEQLLWGVKYIAQVQKAGNGI